MLTGKAVPDLPRRHAHSARCEWRLPVDASFLLLEHTGSNSSDICQDRSPTLGEQSPRQLCKFASRRGTPDLTADCQRQRHLVLAYEGQSPGACRNNRFKWPHLLMCHVLSTYTARGAHECQSRVIAQFRISGTKPPSICHGFPRPTSPTKSIFNPNPCLLHRHPDAQGNRRRSYQ